MPSSQENSVCFIANYSKTYFFAQIADQLFHEKIRVSWITVNENLSKYLKAKYGEENVLLIDKRHSEHHNEIIGEFKINELIYGDRALRHIPELAQRYLINIQKPVYEFLEKHKPKFVFGETTWAHELLIHRMVTQKPELGCCYLCPATVRIPAGRFGFFLGESQDKMLRVTFPIEYKEGKTGDTRIQRPDYFAIMDKTTARARSFKQRLLRLKRFVTHENIDKYDPTLIQNNWIRFKIRAQEELNRETYRFVKRTPAHELKGRQFVFMALHKQPEASIDVLGRYYENQFQNIVNIWRVLPIGWQLVVKEHTNAIGDRGFGFFNKLQNYPGIVIVDEKADSHELIKESKLVVTVSGTVAYEAALLGTPALTFAESFFNINGLCNHVTINDLRRCKSLYDLIPVLKTEIGDIKGEIVRNSFEGIISDPISDPRCVEPTNVRNISQAINSIIEEKYSKII